MKLFSYQLGLKAIFHFSLEGKQLRDDIGPQKTVEDITASAEESDQKAEHK
jgi:hypothetical protein